MRVILFAFCLFTSSVFAREAARFIEGVQGQRLTIEEDGVRLQGYRFLNADGRANTGDFVVFFHGLHSNLHEFEYLVKEKMAEGYDCYAFNFRGHGNGDEASTVLNYTEGAYGFEEMAHTDLPLIMKTVRALSGRHGHVIGHSMGGMVPRAAIALGRFDTSDVDSFVLIGSPPHFRRRSASSDNVLARMLASRILGGRGDDRVGAGDLLSEVEGGLDFLNLVNPFYWAAKAGLRFHMDFVKSVGEMIFGFDSAWSKRAATARIPKDIWRSFAGFQERYPFEEMTIPVPTLYLAGGQDVLVNRDDIESTAERQSDKAGFHFVELPGVGHVSLVAPQALASYSEDLSRFLADPHSLKSKARVRRTPGLCARLLLGL